MILCSSADYCEVWKRNNDMTAVYQ